MGQGERQIFILALSYGGASARGFSGHGAVLEGKGRRQENVVYPPPVLRPLTKTLRVELPADRAYASLPGLPLLQLQVQLLLEMYDVHPGAGGAGHLLDP